MKKVFLLIACQGCVLFNAAQVNYAAHFDNLSLKTYSTSSSSTQYTTVPAGFDLINDSWVNNPGTLTNPNRPFNDSIVMARTGWGVVYNPVENDTFLVSTSWLDTTLVPVDRWLITPAISNITANTVFTWRAKSPDPTYPDGYQLYGTTKQQGPFYTTDFTVGSMLFVLPDGNTGGGGESPNWTRRSISLGSFAGQTLRFAFRNNSRDMYQLWIDDIEAITLPNNVDAAISNEVQKKYILNNVQDTVTVKINNLGAAPITTITLSYQIGNSSVNTENFYSTAGIGYAQSTRIKFALQYAVSQPGYYTVKSWVSSVNGVADQNHSNDTTRYGITVQSTAPAKTVLFEQFTSANNGDGPDAQEKTQALQSSQLIVVNIHDQDSLREFSGAMLVSDYEKNIPSAMVDRLYQNDIGSVTFGRTYYNNRALARENSISPVSVSIIDKNFDPNTRQLSFKVKADFVGEVHGDYRINAYLTENQVGGPVSDTTINGYNQWNNSFNIPWSAYYQKGYYSFMAGTYVLNLGQYRHQNVLVHAFAGPYGDSDTIPSTGGTQGQSYHQTFTFTIPTAAAGVNKFNPDNLYIVGFVAEYNTDKLNRPVLNAAKDKLTTNPEVVGIDELSLNGTLSVYPNPSTGVYYFNSNISGRYTIGVYNTLGSCVKLVDVANSNSMQPLDLAGLADGVYILKIASGRHSFTQKVMLQKGGN